MSVVSLIDLLIQSDPFEVSDAVLNCIVLGLAGGFIVRSFRFLALAVHADAVGVEH